MENDYICKLINVKTIMKKILLALAVLGTVSFATNACNKDNQSEENDGATIVGTWETQDAAIWVKTSSHGKEVSLEAFFQSLGIPVDAMGEQVEEDVPGRIEFTSGGSVVLYEQSGGSNWIKAGEGTYTLKGDQLTLTLPIGGEDGNQMQSLVATVKSLTTSKAQTRIDLTPLVQEMLAAMSQEGEEEAALVLNLFKGCSFYADITLKRV